MRNLLGIGSSMLLVGCMSYIEVEPPRPPETVASCDAATGIWICGDHDAADGRYCCNLTTTDFGQKCRDSVQCQGECIAEGSRDRVGSCSALVAQLGCFYRLNGATNGKRICVD